jgi:hypothetical protein
MKNPDSTTNPPLNRITLGQHKSDKVIPNESINRRVLCTVKWGSNFLLQYAADSVIRDQIKRRALSFNFNSEFAILQVSFVTCDLTTSLSEILRSFLESLDQSLASRFCGFEFVS